jgi:RluA family pseudouridine synthase
MPDAINVLYRDDDLLIIDKPPGLPSHATMDPKRPHVVSLVEKQFGLNYVAMHHRLDRDTSGVLILVTHPRSNAAMADAFKSRAVKKTYRALVWSSAAPKPKWTVENHLAEVGRRGKKRMMGAVRSGGDLAQTAFECVTQRDIDLPRGKVAIVIAEPTTGRTHQIRVHLAQDGKPILGDDLYAPDAVRDLAPRLMLHAESLTFPHPVHHNEMTVTAPLPRDFNACWGLF